MKAMILCAGLGTRLKPWTDSHPKALVPVAGVPMLKRVAQHLISEGFDEITVNVHHFAGQIREYIRQENILSGISVSDETEMLLDTGGGILHAQNLLGSDGRPFLVHNVDILSNADLSSLMDEHVKSGADVTLLVSDRISDRKLVFDASMTLKGWVNQKTGQMRPAALCIEDSDLLLSFSGIYVMDPHVFEVMKDNGFADSFTIMDFFLSDIPGLRIRGVDHRGLELIDIGKPDTLHRANLMIQ